MNCVTVSKSRDCPVFCSATCPNVQVKYVGFTSGAIIDSQKQVPTEEGGDEESGEKGEQQHVSETNVGTFKACNP
jgi:hypothetical protein